MEISSNQNQQKRKTLLLNFRGDAEFSVSRETLEKLTEQMDLGNYTETIHYFLAKLAIAVLPDFKSKCANNSESFRSIKPAQDKKKSAAKVMVYFKTDTVVSVSRETLCSLTDHYGFLSDTQTILYALSIGAKKLKQDIGLEIKATQKPS